MIKILKLDEAIQYKDTSKIKYLYHTVFSNRTFEYVMKYGIRADSKGLVYLAEKPIIKKALNPKFTDGISTRAVFKVTIPDNRNLYDWREFWCDDNGEEIDFDHQYDPTNPYYCYTGSIPKQYVKLYKEFKS